MDKPTINHDQGCLPRVIDQTIEALAKKGGFFRWAGGLYVLYTLTKDQDGPVKRGKGSVVLVPLTVSLAVEMATDAAGHRKWDSRANDYKVTNCPRQVAEGVMARGYWPEFPELLGVVEAATLDLDGREISAMGCDPKTGIFVATAAKLPEMKGKRGRAAGAHGVKVLLDFLSDFPFVSPADKSAALAAVMTALLRRLLPAAPMFGITAPTPGTGKTLLAEVVSIIATGRRPPVLSMGNDENEFTKRVYGVLLAGDIMVLIDNVTRPMGTEDVLNQLISQPFLRFRPLGGSGMVTAPTNALVMVTGNNLYIVGDAKRRTCLIRVDAKIERPEQREFSRDILAETLSRRDELIRAALEISKSYIETGCPAVDARPYGSFSDWDRMVRRPLIWHGCDDPLLASEGLRDSDPDLEAMRLMFTAWRDKYQDKAATAAEVIQAGLEYGLTQHVNPELHDALQLACAGKIDPRRLGNWLRYHKDRIIDGMQLVQDGIERTRAVRWKLVQL